MSDSPPPIPRKRTRPLEAAPLPAAAPCAADVSKESAAAAPPRASVSVALCLPSGLYLWVDAAGMVIESKDAVCFTATAVAGAGDSPSLTFTSPNGPLAVAGPDGAPVSVWTLVCRGGDVILAAAEPPARVVWNPAAAPPLSLQSEAEVGTPLRPIFRNSVVPMLFSNAGSVARAVSSIRGIAMASPPPRPFPLPLPSFEFLSVMNSGTRGCVLLARVVAAPPPCPPTLVPGACVALKAVPVDARLAAELDTARAVCGVTDSSLLQVHSWWVDTQHAIIAMEACGELRDSGRLHVEDVDALVALSSGRPPSPHVPFFLCVRVLSSLLTALQAMHTRGYIHCDVHPGNVLTWGDRVALIDFGSAQRKGSDGGRVYVGPIRGGKWVFAPPEQIIRESGHTEKWHPSLAPLPPKTVALDDTLDLFSAAAVCVYMLTGRPPFLPLHLRSEKAGRVREADVLRHPNRDPATLAASLPADVPEPLVALLAKALDPVPANRFPSAASMLEALAATGV